MRSSRSVFIRWVVVLAFGALIYYFSALPPTGMPLLPFPHFDKVLHFVVYGVLGLLLFRALWADPTRAAPTGVLVLGVILATLYGVTDEFHQSFVPGRDFSVWDMAANGAGAAVAAALWEPLTHAYAWLK